MEGTLSSESSLKNKFKLENGSCIDNLGHNLVDQVFYDQSVLSLVVEISETGKDAFLLQEMA